MDARRLRDPAAFLRASADHLLDDEARHNLLLGIAGTLRDHPGVYAEFDLWLVDDDGDLLLAALRTPPYNLVVSRPRVPTALRLLAERLAGEPVALPGVTGAEPEADAFAEEWSRLTGARARKRMAQRVYSLTRVRPVADVPGHARRATRADRSLLIEWVRAFTEESLPADAPGRDARAMIDARLEAGTGGFLLWEDAGRPVSLAGWGGATPNGMRVGPVYTPPEHRRRGYASAVTASASADLLATGRSFCFLYTDLANPTSNRIYLDIGYEPVCDSADYAFAEASQA